MKIQLKGRSIPRNEGGDPAFVRMQGGSFPVLSVFTEEEVVELVNRAIYQLEYQHASHKRRGQEQRDKEKAVREKVKQMFKTSWMKATVEQIRKATEEVDREKGG